MSTNHYAIINIDSNSSLTSSLKLHIGKTGSGVILSGDWFDSFDAWKIFLRYNSDKLEVRDEYGTEQDIEEFIERIESFKPEERERQYRVIEQDHAHRLKDNWLDAEGYSMTKGVFF